MRPHVTAAKILKHMGLLQDLQSVREYYIRDNGPRGNLHHGGRLHDRPNVEPETG